MAESDVAPNPPLTPGPRILGIDPSVAERRVRLERSWERAVEAHANGSVVSGVVGAPIAGGFAADVDGVAAFLPASQVVAPDGGSADRLAKTRVSVVVVDVDAKRRRLVVSQRRALDIERRRKRDALFASLAIGQRHDATVVRLAPFGAFVDIGGPQGLVPIGELALERVERVEDVAAVGDRFAVDVIRIDEGGRKIAFSRKSALPDPWRDHADLLRVGAEVAGTVVTREPRLGVELAPGVVGTFREGDVDPAEYAIGERVDVVVRFVDRRQRRIGLTTTHAIAGTASSADAGAFATLGEELRARFGERA